MSKVQCGGKRFGEVLPQLRGAVSGWPRICAGRQRVSFVWDGGATGCEVLCRVRRAIGSCSFLATARGGDLNLRELWRTGESRHQVLSVLREGHPIQRAGHSGHDAYCGDLYTTPAGVPRPVATASSGGGTSKACRNRVAGTIRTIPTKNGTGCGRRTIRHGAAIKREQSASHHHYRERGGTRFGCGRTDLSLCVAEARRPESANRRNTGSGAADSISAAGDQYRAGKFRVSGAGNSRNTAGGRIAGREYCVSGGCGGRSGQGSKANTV